MQARAALVPLVLAPLAACNALLGTPDPELRDTADAATELVVAFPSDDAGGEGADGDAIAPFPGTADASADVAPPVCSGAIVDLSRDSDNCGACGHSCQGAPCRAGRCTPYLLAGSPASDRGLKSLYGLARIGDTLYGTDWYQPFALVYATSTHASVAQPAPVFPPPLPDGGTAADGAGDALATDGTNLYFSIYNDTPTWNAGVWSLDGGGNARHLADTRFVSYVAADAQRVYWADESGAIFSAKKDGSDLQTADCHRSYGTPLVAANGRVYYATNRRLVAADPSALASPIVTYTGATHADRFVVDATHAYWIDVPEKRVYRAPLAGGPPVDLTAPGVPTSAPYYGLLVDDAHLYVDNWSTDGAATIVRIAKDGSSPSAEVMLQTNDGIAAWTQDERTIYFTTYGTDSPGFAPFAAVWKLAK